MNISDNGQILIKAFEGLHLSAYQNKNDPVTIGWGFTGSMNGKPIVLGMTITCEEANTFYATVLQNKYGRAINNYITKYNCPLSQQQFDVMCSRAFNFGVNKSLVKGIFPLLKSNASEEKIKEFIYQGTKSRGVESPGLVIRRRAEYVLWSTGQLTQDVLNRYNSKIKVCNGAKVDVSKGVNDKGDYANSSSSSNSNQVDLQSAYKEINAFLLTGKAMSDAVTNKKEGEETKEEEQEETIKSKIDPTHPKDEIVSGAEAELKSKGSLNDYNTD